MQSGELVVSGKDKIQIRLTGLPVKVDAYFSDNCEPVDHCGTHHTDQVEYEIHTSHTHHHTYLLVISWNVAGVREVKWTAYY